MDGTLFDVTDRYVKSYEDVLGRKVDGNKIIALRREGKSGLEIICTITGKAQGEARPIDAIRKKLMNDNSLLHLDELLPGITEALEKLQKSGIRLFALTMRNEQGVVDEFEKHGIKKYFEGIYSNDSPGEAGNPAAIKEKGLLRIIKQKHLNPSTTCIVGDTEAEIIAGRNSDILSVGVLTGLSSRELLAKAKPDAIVDSVEQLDSIKWNG